MTDLTTVTATELSSLYQSGAVSPVTVAQQVLAKIERVNPVINAFCFTDPDTTLKQAQASEQRWRQGQQLSALDGIPISVKDSILTKGWPTLHGSLTVDADQPWLEDHPAVDTLRNAGAVFLGKTAVPEFNLRADTYSELHGITRNPWNLEYSPGGSSGGSAAAVAAGLGPISLASDANNSIALPASFCGITGFKPSGNTVNGPMATTVDDILLATQIRPATTNVKNLKIFYLRNDCFNETIGYTDATVELLKAQGFDIQEFDVGIDIFKVYKFFQNFLQTNQQSGMISKTAEYLLEKTKHCDLIISPSTTVTAFKANELPPMYYLRKKYKNINLTRSYSFLWNITGQPAVTIPTGLANNGLPLGIQIVGGVGCDNLVLQFAKAIEPLFPKLQSPLM
jgi:aspartyl-tRNA(Asn)/glutamyl-tRNA(Gln) amidotransferase subunit A